jgi:hypothetical protein
LRWGCAGNVNVAGSANSTIRVYYAFAKLYFKVSVFPKVIAEALGRSNRSISAFNARTADNNIALSVHKADLFIRPHVKRVIRSKRKPFFTSVWADNSRSGD